MKPVVTRSNVMRDAAAAAGMIGVALLGLIVSYDFIEADGSLDEVPPVWISMLLVVAMLAPLVVRRLRPVIAVALVTVLFAVVRVSEVPEATVSTVALFVVIYSVGAWEESAVQRFRWRTFAVAVSMGVLAWSILYQAEYVNVDAALATVFSVVINAVFFAAAWAMGDLARIRHENELELQLRADQLAAEREERARRAVVDERVRIARELHDVVAHHVSVMGVQAGAARRILANDPVRASEALLSIEESGRQAVGELQKLVGFLRSGDEGDPIGPQPTLADLDRLFEQTGAAGLQVELRIIGAERPVPSSVSLSAYRIIQESLTNVLKHAGPVPVTVVLTYTAGSLDVEVVNRGGGGASKPGGGRGLMGMRERATMLGGTFRAGATNGGGYRVAVSLPTGTAYDEVSA
jgi:signal transduction histidine kinase